MVVLIEPGRVLVDTRVWYSVTEVVYVRPPGIVCVTITTEVGPVKMDCVAVTIVVT